MDPNAGFDAALMAHAIQFAVAPVFLLTGVGAILNVAVVRLNRVIDRARMLEGGWPSLDAQARRDTERELATLARRARLTSWAINTGTASALLICLVIAALFADALLGTQLKWLIGVLFILSMATLSTGLVCFLREVYLATHTLRIGPPLR